MYLKIDKDHQRFRQIVKGKIRDDGACFFLVLIDSPLQGRSSRRELYRPDPRRANRLPGARSALNI